MSCIAMQPPSVNATLKLSVSVYDNHTDDTPCGNTGFCMSIKMNVESKGWGVLTDAEYFGISFRISANHSDFEPSVTYANKLYLGNTQVIFNDTATVTSPSKNTSDVKVTLLPSTKNDNGALLAYDYLALILDGELSSEMKVSMDALAPAPTPPSDHSNLIIPLVVSGCVVLFISVVGSIYLVRKSRSYEPIYK
eukprot:TRINITY_DN15706_c0_g1_i1.p1 TRINITY_DN15706_c0_g1~~TRINITY_DN15706_c0_g1_i1.p1  ORF type:complete len:210 (-),score=26.55 TRINITY_DN15706_c0_g1_i1:10-591(-)